MVIGGGGDWSAYHPFSNVMVSLERELASYTDS